MNLCSQIGPFFFLEDGMEGRRSYSPTFFNSIFGRVLMGGSETRLFLWDDCLLRVVFGSLFFDIGVPEFELRPFECLEKVTLFEDWPCCVDDLALLLFILASTALSFKRPLNVLRRDPSVRRMEPNKYCGDSAGVVDCDSCDGDGDADSADNGRVEVSLFLGVTNDVFVCLDTGEPAILSSACASACISGVEVVALPFVVSVSADDGASNVSAKSSLVVVVLLRSSPSTASFKHDDDGVSVCVSVVGKGGGGVTSEVGVDASGMVMSFTAAMFGISVSSSGSFETSS
mmetsp:Transcript_28282/g.79452  ORF Transcript_28282/g.79452 Transcript_28282/m.79452 type:complete len:287 (+) Transcript_28282:456-1316(+)